MIAKNSRSQEDRSPAWAMKETMDGNDGKQLRSNKGFADLPTQSYGHRRVAGFAAAVLLASEGGLGSHVGGGEEEGCFHGEGFGHWADNTEISRCRQNFGTQLYSWMRHIGAHTHTHF